MLINPSLARLFIHLEEKILKACSEKEGYSVFSSKTNH